MSSSSELPPKIPGRYRYKTSRLAQARETPPFPELANAIPLPDWCFPRTYEETVISLDVCGLRTTVTSSRPVVIDLRRSRASPLQVRLQDIRPGCKTVHPGIRQP